MLVAPPSAGFQLTRVQFDPSNPAGTMRPILSKLSLPGAGAGAAIAADQGASMTGRRVQDKNIFEHELKAGARPGREKARAGSRAKGKTGRQVISTAAATGAIHSRRPLSTLQEKHYVICLRLADLRSFWLLPIFSLSLCSSSFLCLSFSLFLLLQNRFLLARGVGNTAAAEGAPQPPYHTHGTLVCSQADCLHVDAAVALSEWAKRILRILRIFAPPSTPSAPLN